MTTKELHKGLRNIERLLSSSQKEQRVLDIELLSSKEYRIVFDTYFRQVLMLYAHIHPSDIVSNCLYNYYTNHVYSDSVGNYFILSLLNDGVTEETKKYLQQALDNIFLARFFVFKNPITLPLWMQDLGLCVENITVGDRNGVYGANNKLEETTSLHSIFRCFKKSEYLHVLSGFQTLSNICNMTAHLQVHYLDVKVWTLNDYNITSHINLKSLTLRTVTDGFVVDKCLAPTGLNQLAKLNYLKLSHLDSIESLELPITEHQLEVDITNTDAAGKLLEVISFNHDTWDGEKVVISNPNCNVSFLVKNSLPF